jgi:hypothetical protein
VSLAASLPVCVGYDLSSPSCGPTRDLRRHPLRFRQRCRGPRVSQELLLPLGGALRLGVRRHSLPRQARRPANTLALGPVPALPREICAFARERPSTMIAESTPPSIPQRAFEMIDWPQAPPSRRPCAWPPSPQALFAQALCPVKVAAHWTLYYPHRKSVETRTRQSRASTGSAMLIV